MRFVPLFCVLVLAGCDSKDKGGGIADAGGGTTTPRAAANDTRTYWAHARGHFEKLPDGTWTEVAPDGGHAFAETARTDKFVELTDRQRNIVVTLYGTDATVKVGNNKPNSLYQGGWETKPAGAAPATPAGDWSSDPALANKLAAETDVNGYRVRPPLGYAKDEKTQGGTKSFNWTGPRRRDGSAPRFWVLVGKLSPADQTAPLGLAGGAGFQEVKQKLDEAKQTAPLEKGLAVVQNPLRSGLAGYGESPPERGKIGGLTFLRVSFQGVETVGADPLPIGGIVYHAHDGDTYIHMKLIDKRQFTAESYPVLEAAARTLRKP